MINVEVNVTENVSAMLASVIAGLSGPEATDINTALPPENEMTSNHPESNA